MVPGATRGDRYKKRMLALGLGIELISLNPEPQPEPPPQPVFSNGAWRDTR